jgi:hypothetical protein
MLYREIITVCSQIHTKHTNTLCGQNARFLLRTPSCWGMTLHYCLISPLCSGRTTLPRANATTFIPPTPPWLAHQPFFWLACQPFQLATDHSHCKSIFNLLPALAFFLYLRAFEDQGTMHLPNTGSHSPNDTASYQSRTESSSTSMWKPQDTQDF